MNNIIFYFCLFLFVSAYQKGIAQCKLDSAKLVTSSYLSKEVLKNDFKNFCFDDSSNAEILNNVIFYRLKNSLPSSIDLIEFNILNMAQIHSIERQDKPSMQFGIELLNNVIKIDTLLTKDEKLKLLNLKYELLKNGNIKTVNPILIKQYETEKTELLSNIIKEKTKKTLDENLVYYTYCYDYANLLWSLNPRKNKELALNYLSNILRYDFIWIEDPKIFEKFERLAINTAIQKLEIIRGDLKALEVSYFWFPLPEYATKIHQKYIEELGGVYPPKFWYTTSPKRH